jgi:nucleoside-diphosphate-sugar epimerase
MKILVTGSTGFVGKYVVEQFQKEPGHQIICTSTNLEKAKMASWFDKVTYIECDLSKNIKNYFEFFQCPDLMIHLAWKGLPHYNESYHVDQNLPSDCIFIKNMIENGLKNLSVTGTCFEYGLNEGCLEESMVTNPVTAYGIAKDTLRKYIEQLKLRFDFNYKWIRLFYMFGEGQSRSSILELLKKSAINGEKKFDMSGGEQLRDYLSVNDVAKYIVNISKQTKYQGVINCCSGNPISIRRLVEQYCKKNNYSIKLNMGVYPYPVYEPLAFWGSDNLINKVLTS